MFFYLGYEIMLDSYERIKKTAVLAEFWEKARTAETEYIFLISKNMPR